MPVSKHHWNRTNWTTLCWCVNLFKRRLLLLKNANILHADIDECVRNTHNCSAELLEECINTERSYDCVCQNGYYRDTPGPCVGKKHFNSMTTVIVLIHSFIPVSQILMNAM